MSNIIPTASEARHHAESLTNVKVQEQLEQVGNIIKKAAARGDLKTDYTPTILEPVRREPERLGYKISQLNDPREGSWSVISW